MRNLVFIGFWLLLGHGVYAQNGQGSVSYVTEENVYVRFESTRGLEIGDTLFKGDGTPCLVVSRTSSISAVTSSIEGCLPSVGEAMSFTPTPVEEVQEVVEGEEETQEEVTGTSEETESEEPQEEDRGTSGRGRISTGAYGVYSPNSTDVGYIRSVTRLGLDVNRIAGRDLNLSVYGNYQAYLRMDDQPTNFPSQGRAQIYNAKLQYRPTADWMMTLGRFINPNTSSMGSVDGLSVERQLGSFYAGVIAGFRPDYVTFGTRTDQFEYGLYAGWGMVGDNVRSNTTLGLLEQTLSGATDRRYLYAQHTTSWDNGLSFFASSEVDLFENYDTADAQSTVRLTHLYLSLNYRINRSWSAFVSYDTRQQILFFETFDNEVEQLLSNQGMQNGARIRLNYRSRGGWMVSGGYHRRFGREDRVANNANLSIGHSNIPWIGGRFVVRGNLNSNSYLSSEVVSARYSNSFAKGNVNWGIYGRMLNYHNIRYENVAYPLYWYMGTDWSVSMDDGWQLGILAEYSLRDDHDVIRCNVQLIKRFGW